MCIHSSNILFLKHKILFVVLFKLFFISYDKISSIFTGRNTSEILALYLVLTYMFQ